MRHHGESYLRKLPKAELHLHLEGSITAARLADLASKYGTEYADLTRDKLSDRLFRYKDFQAFLDTYKVVCDHLRSAEDYVALLDDLKDYFLRQNIRYAEIIFSPSIADRFGRDGEEILQALLAHTPAVEKAARLKIRWILDCVRQWGPEAARRTAELAVEYSDRGVVGLGLGGDENSLPIDEFQEVFLWAKAHEVFIHVHAGETGGPEQVWDALRKLSANRIGHGIHAARDGHLIDYLRDHAIGLDVCLTSNLKTKAWTPISTNPFGLLFKRGVAVSLNTDDPGLFETTLVEEYAKAVSIFKLSRDDLHRLVLQGLRSAFLNHEDRMLLMQSFTDQIHRLSDE